LVVGGLDPSHGAGLDADREAWSELDPRRLAVREVVTARTDQDDRAVRAVGAVDPELWLAEALEAGEVEAIKLGLLPGAGALEAAARLVRARPAAAVVLDPVIASTSGHEFLDERARAVLLASLVPLGVVLTPNLPEAACLAGASAPPEGTDLGARLELARALLARGARAVVLKGGHGAEDPVRDLCLEREREPRWIEHPRLPGAHLRGTGCRFATFLAAHLALGLPVAAAAERAAAGVARRLVRAAGS